MKNLYLASLLFLSITAIIAQNPADKDPSFPSGKSFSKSGYILCLTRQADGKIIVGGDFGHFDNAVSNNIVRLNPDGSIDNTFNSGTGLDFEPYSLAVQPDGKILVGGLFNTYNGSPVSYLIRLNSNGSLDSTFNSTGTGFEGFSAVYAIKVQADGKILLGGGFSQYNGVTTNNILRLNSNGSLDTGFNMGTGFGGQVQSIELQPDGKILVAGAFNSYNGTTAKNIVRLNSDGTIDSSLNTSYLESFGSAEIVLQPDQKILFLSNFISVGDQFKYGIIRINSDGSYDNTFTTGIEFNYSVEAAAVQADNKVVICGTFNKYNGVTAKKVLRLNTNGTADATFNIGSGFNATGEFGSHVSGVHVLPDGKLLFSGSFTSYNNSVSSALARINANGSIDNTFNTKKSFFSSAYGPTVKVMKQQPDGKILIAGDFDYYFNEPSKGIIRINTNGTKDNTFQVGTGASGDVRTIALQQDGKILIGGSFYGYGTSLATNLTRINTDGSSDNTFSIGLGVDGTVLSVALQSDGKILFGGLIGAVNGEFVKNLVRLNSNGSTDTGFSVNLDTAVNSILVQPDGKIVTGGIYFNRFNSDGHPDDTFNTGGAVFASNNHAPDLYQMLLQPDGKILVVGNFTNYGSTTSNHIIRINTNGTADNTFDTTAGNGNLFECAALQPDGKVVLGISNFNTGVKVLRVHQNGLLDNTFDAGDMDNEVKAVLVQSDKTILVGGNFTTYDGTEARGLLKVLGDSQLSNEKFANIRFSFYPNPVINQINIQSPGNMQIDQVVVTDLYGKSILKYNGGSQINVENLSAGMYVLTIFSGNEKWNGKFIKE